MTSIIFATTVLLLCSVVAHVLAVNRAFCEQHCVHKATHRIRVSFLVFHYIPHQQLLFSKCDWTILPSSTSGHCFTSSIQVSGGNYIIWPYLDRCLFHLNSTSANILPLSADISLVVKTSPAHQTHQTLWQQARPFDRFAWVLYRKSLNWATKQSSRGSLRIEELPPLVEASKLIFYLSQS